MLVLHLSLVPNRRISGNETSRSPARLFGVERYSFTFTLQVCLCLCLCAYSNFTRRPSIVIEVFRDFLELLQLISGIQFHTGTSLFPSESFPIHYSLSFIHSFIHSLYTSVSQPLWDRGPVNSFFIRRGPRPNKFTRKYLSIFFKFIH